MGIRNPWYYNGNVVRDIKRWVENKESGGIWVDVDGVKVKIYMHKIYIKCKIYLT